MCTFSEKPFCKICKNNNNNENIKLASKTLSIKKKLNSNKLKLIDFISPIETLQQLNQQVNKHLKKNNID